MSGLRVLHLVASFEVGGLQKGVTTLLNHGSVDIEHRVLSLAPEVAMAERLTRGEVESLGVPMGTRQALWPAITERLKSFRPHVLHTRNWPTFIDGVRARAAASVPVHVHGHHGRDVATAGGFGWKRRLAGRWCSRRLDRVVTLTASMAAEWRHEFGAPRGGLQLIPNGVTFPDDRATPGAPGPFRVLAVGRLDAVKDYPTLIRAFASMPGRAPEDRLEIAGAGPEAAALRALGDELGLGAALEMPGAVVPATPRYVEAQAFVQSSIYEGMSNTIVEAMAAGLPVLATAVGGNPDVVGEAGRLFTPGDVQALATALAQLREHPEDRQKLGDQAAQRARETFAIPVMVGAYEKLWRDLAEAS